MWGACVRVSHKREIGGRKKKIKAQVWQTLLKINNNLQTGLVVKSQASAQPSASHQPMQNEEFTATPVISSPYLIPLSYATPPPSYSLSLCRLLLMGCLLLLTLCALVQVQHRCQGHSIKWCRRIGGGRQCPAAYYNIRSENGLCLRIIVNKAEKHISCLCVNR